MLKHIVVTQEDIDRGTPLQGSHCPVYFAIERVCKDVIHVSSDRADFLNPDENDLDISVPLPTDTSIRIITFDDLAGMEPFSFDLDIPDEVVC